MARSSSWVRGARKGITTPVAAGRSYRPARAIGFGRRRLHLILAEQHAVASLKAAGFHQLLNDDALVVAARLLRRGDYADRDPSLGRMSHQPHDVAGGECDRARPAMVVMMADGDAKVGGCVQDEGAADVEHRGLDFGQHLLQLVFAAALQLCRRRGRLAGYQHLARRRACRPGRAE
ncbi:hypothetical protein [Bordetella bronchiseptica]|uniref:hypothetical protein n=1 Tax=Bordetella bronchiseptica TaxID=518 RepID=UPI0021635D15|nr:hypothetical protein [Bordetella bronchiseptica]